MARHTYFTDDIGLHQPNEGGLVRNGIPEQVRNATARFCSELLPAPGMAWRFMINELDLPHDSEIYGIYGQAEEYDNKHALLRYVTQTDWASFLNVVSAICYFLQETDVGVASRFRETVNSSFIRYYSAYQMIEDGSIREPGTAPAEATVAQARALLAAEQFDGPDRQFQVALQELGARHEANYELAISNCANALEGVARILTADENATLAEALKTIQKSKKLHPALAQSISNLYGYASDAGGATRVSWRARRRPERCGVLPASIRSRDRLSGSTVRP